jgi:hypothetical protein
MDKTTPLPSLGNHSVYIPQDLVSKMTSDNTEELDVGQQGWTSPVQKQCGGPLPLKSPRQMI